MPDDEEFIEEFDQTGTHAFLFVDHVSETTTPEEVVGALRERAGGGAVRLHVRRRLPGVRASPGRGGRPRGDRQLQDLIEEIVRIGLGASTGWRRIQPLGAKRRSPD